MNDLLSFSFQDFVLSYLIPHNKDVEISATHFNIYSLAFLEWSLWEGVRFGGTTFLLKTGNQGYSYRHLCICLIVNAPGGSFYSS